MILFFRSLPRLFKNANKDMRRHFSMTFSAVLSIAISLLFALIMAVLAINIDGISQSIESQMQLQVSIVPSYDEMQIETLQNEISSISGVASVTYSSKEEELAKLIAENGEMFAQYEDSNPLYNIYVVDVDPVDAISQVSAEIEKLPGVLEVSYGGSAITTLISIFSAIRKIGYLLAGGLMILGIFLIRNTVRMTIMVREQEISIMRTVGAYNFYIRTPFMLIGIAMGFWGAFIPVVIVDAAYSAFYNSLSGVFISDLFVLYPPFPFLLWLSLAAFAIGILLGAFGSYLAVRKLIRRTR